MAVEKGLNHARLPIDDFVKLKTRKVLTIDHVFRILASVCEGKTWKEAFLDTLPARKGVEEREPAHEAEQAKPDFEKDPGVNATGGDDDVKSLRSPIPTLTEKLRPS